MPRWLQILQPLHSLIHQWKYEYNYHIDREVLWILIGKQWERPPTCFQVDARITEIHEVSAPIFFTVHTLCLCSSSVHTATTTSCYIFFTVHTATTTSCYIFFTVHTVITTSCYIFFTVHTAIGRNTSSQCSKSVPCSMSECSMFILFYFTRVINLQHCITLLRYLTFILLVQTSYDLMNNENE